MKCIVNRIVEIATARVKGVETPIKLNELQERVQKTFQLHDFGCNTNAVAAMLEALTGHKPTKGPGAGFKLMDVGQMSNGKELRFLVLGVDSGYTYGYSVDNPKSGHIAVNSNNVKQLSTEEKLAIITKFAECDDVALLNFMVQNLGGSFPAILFAELD